MKTVVITGASRGIGRAAVERFLAEGWRVIGTSTSGKLPFDAKQVTAVQLDLGNSESIAKAAKEILQTERIDVLVNSAGIILDAFDAVPEIETIRKTVEIDLVGTVDITERLLPAMVKGSHIINIDSSYGMMCVPIDDNSSVGYRLAKAALNMYTKSLAFRLKERGLIVSSIDPGWCKTDMGNAAATETEKPTREPHEAAEDIYKLATGAIETGHLWHFGKMMEW